MAQQSTPRSVRIDVVTAQNMPIEVPLRGRTKAKSSVSVVAQTAGTVQTVTVTKGQTVKAGDLLCTLDQGARKLAVDQAQAGGRPGADRVRLQPGAGRRRASRPTTPRSPRSPASPAPRPRCENAQLELDRTDDQDRCRRRRAGPAGQCRRACSAPASPAPPSCSSTRCCSSPRCPKRRSHYAKLGLTADDHHRHRRQGRGQGDLHRADRRRRDALVPGRDRDPQCRRQAARRHHRRRDRQCRHRAGARSCRSRC